MTDSRELSEDYFEPHVPEFKEDGGVLNFTQNLRLQIIQTKTRNGSQIGKMSDEDIETVLRAANDLDRQALTAMKLKSDNQNSDADRKVAMMVASLNLKLARNPFELPAGSVVDGAPPSVPDSVFSDSVVPEYAMELGISNENSEEFMKKFARE